MKAKDRNAAKDLYRQLRAYSWPRLWAEEVARFDAATPPEREKQVAVIRAVGVVFAELRPSADEAKVREWLLRLLHDPSEKVRRYAAAALPKLGPGASEEEALLTVLRSTTGERERQFMQRAVGKIGGHAALAEGALGEAEQKVKASLARRENPSALRFHAVLNDFAGARLHLRGRQGMEHFIKLEVEESDNPRGKFRVAEAQPGCVTLVPLAAFSLADVYALRCFDTMSFMLGQTATESSDELAAAITSESALNLWRTLTDGAIRYRLNFVGKGHQRAAIDRLAGLVYARRPEILNDGRSVTWTVDIYPNGGGCLLELRPNLTPDPRFSYRQQDVPAASHPSLAAALARLSRAASRDVIWDPFCGSGLELAECARLAPGLNLVGSDLSPEAVRIAGKNFAAATVKSSSVRFFAADFRQAAKQLAPESVNVVITNPPMGRRAPVADLQRLIGDFFGVATRALKPGGRLVFVNPLSIETRHPLLQLQFQQEIDMGGFACRVEKYVKAPRP